jgi:type VI protein secretion system component VasK
VPLAEDAAEDEVNEETRELNERIKETQREHRRFKRLGDLINEQLKLLRELKKLHGGRTRGQAAPLICRT